MFVSMAVVLAWAGWIGWRRWPEWRAVREMRAAVEANKPGRFLDCVEQVDSLGVAEAAADEIAPLRHHADPRVRMVAVTRPVQPLPIP
jgi:predicted negative regulator of RcsB-dependent stress response